MDSLIFMPIAFFGTPLKVLATMMLFQVSFKVLYEIIILPVTAMLVPGAHWTLTLMEPMSSLGTKPVRVVRSM